MNDMKRRTFAPTLWFCWLHCISLAFTHRELHRVLHNILQVSLALEPNITATRHDVLVPKYGILDTYRSGHLSAAACCPSEGPHQQYT